MNTVLKFAGYQKQDTMHLVTLFIVNPRHAGTSRVTVVVLCVCVSVFSNLPSHAFRHPTRGISEYSVENAIKTKSRFL